jgi:hypothetical protein
VIGIIIVFALTTNSAYAISKIIENDGGSCSSTKSAVAVAVFVGVRFLFYMVFSKLLNCTKYVDVYYENFWIQKILRASNIY